MTKISFLRLPFPKQFSPLVFITPTNHHTLHNHRNRRNLHRLLHNY